MMTFILIIIMIKITLFILDTIACQVKFGNSSQTKKKNNPLPNYNTSRLIEVEGKDITTLNDSKVYLKNESFGPFSGCVIMKFENVRLKKKTYYEGGFPKDGKSWYSNWQVEYVLQGKTILKGWQIIF